MKRRSPTESTSRRTASSMSLPPSTSSASSLEIHNCSLHRRYLSITMMALVFISTIIPSRGSYHRHQVGWTTKSTKMPTSSVILSPLYHDSYSRMGRPSQWLLPQTNPIEIVEKLRGGASKNDEKEEEDDESTGEESEQEVIVQEEDDDVDEEEEEAGVEASEDGVEESEAEEEYDDESDDESDDEYEVVEEDEEEGDDESDDDEEGLEDYVEPYFMPQSLSLGITVGCMVISQRVDLYNPTIIRLLRFAYITQILLQQALVLYVRVMAKKNNDQRSVVTQNPLSTMIQSQLQQKQQKTSNNNDGGMVKNLASSLLSTTTTVMDYDRKQAHSMQGQIIFAMAFMWFLHFKMGQVQPLLIQTVNDITKLIYSPLFQVYVLGRNLERPFKTPATAPEDNEDEGDTTETEDDESAATSEDDEDDESDDDEEEEDEEEEEEETDDDDEEDGDEDDQEGEDSDEEE